MRSISENRKARAQSLNDATFDGVIRFVRSLVDHVSEHQAVFVVSVSPDSLKVQERSILERELEPIRP
jgi:hypothetical protein